jgi:membrane protease YdiL (CAAX protease family)
MRDCRWRLHGCCGMRPRPIPSNGATGAIISFCWLLAWRLICAGSKAAWPSGLRALNELFLVDAGLYGFLAIRQLRGTGYNFCLRWSDWKTGLRELLFFAPPVVVLGIALGFIHPHRNLPGIGSALLRWVAIFFFTAVPEELFFRAWVQNLLERRVGRRAALGDCVGCVWAVALQ